KFLIKNKEEIFTVPGDGNDIASPAMLHLSKMSFHEALDLFFELNETTIRCTWDILRQKDFLDRLSKIPWVIPTFIVIESEDNVAEFSGPSRWKELSKEISSKILPCGDGSCWKTFKPVLIWILRPKSMECASVFHQPDGVRSKRYHIVPYGELNDIHVALVARCTWDILRQKDFLDRLSKIPWVIPTFIVIESEDNVAEFSGPSRWKELSKEISSKILPCGDGSCWKTFKPVASLIAKGKLK
nr:hypothetical protein [Tanacetum cinerariifolium]